MCAAREGTCRWAAQAVILLIAAQVVTLASGAVVHTLPGVSLPLTATTFV